MQVLAAFQQACDVDAVTDAMRLQGTTVTDSKWRCKCLYLTVQQTQRLYSSGGICGLTLEAVYSMLAKCMTASDCPACCMQNMLNSNQWQHHDAHCSH